MGQQARAWKPHSTYVLSSILHAAHLAATTPNDKPTSSILRTTNPTMLVFVTHGGRHLTQRKFPILWQASRPLDKQPCQWIIKHSTANSSPPRPQMQRHGLGTMPPARKKMRSATCWSTTMLVMPQRSLHPIYGGFPYWPPISTSCKPRSSSHPAHCWCSDIQGMNPHPYPGLPSQNQRELLQLPGQWLSRTASNHKSINSNLALVNKARTRKMLMRTLTLVQRDLGIFVPHIKYTPQGIVIKWERRITW